MLKFYKFLICSRTDLFDFTVVKRSIAKVSSLMSPHSAPGPVHFYLVHDPVCCHSGAAFFPAASCSMSIRSTLHVPASIRSTASVMSWPNLLFPQLPGFSQSLPSDKSRLIFRKFRIFILFIFFIRFYIDIFHFVSYYNYIKRKGGRTTENLIETPKF